MTMPPIKFEIKPGLWIGVGDRVWTLYGNNPRTGIVTGFGGNENEWLIVEVTHTSDPVDGYSRQSTMEYTFSEVFSSERDAWKSKLEKMISESDDLQRRMGLLDKEIDDLTRKINS